MAIKSQHCEDTKTEYANQLQRANEMQVSAVLGIVLTEYMYFITISTSVNKESYCINHERLSHMSMSFTE